MVIKRAMEARARLVVLCTGTVIVAVWTVLRHITNGVNFDIVGQVGIADQWLHGLHDGVTLGQTNYLLKMPLYMIADGLHFLSPMNRLLFFALLFNITAFVLIFALIEKILVLENVRNRGWFYVAMLWFASIAGGVYWLDYANSRNLETAAGVWLIYLVLRYIKMPNRMTLIWLAVSGAVIFFADPLQLYTIGGGIVLYAAGRWLFVRNQANRSLAINLCAALVISYVGAKILMVLSKLLLPVQYLAVPPTHHALNLSTLGTAAKTLFMSTFQIFDADVFKRPLGPNTLREIINFVILAAIAALIVWVLTKPKSLKPSGALLLCIMLADYGAYIASKQVLEPNTSRYLIMVPIMAVIFVSLYMPSLSFSRMVLVRNLSLVAVGVSCLLLIGGLAKSWPDRHAKDQHIYETLSYLTQNNFRYALGSHELGVTTTYFAADNATVLPISCTADGHLHKINLFYDKGAFNGLKSYSGMVPVIITQTSIASGVDTCDAPKITAILGQPQREVALPGIGVAELYDVRVVNRALQAFH